MGMIRSKGASRVASSDGEVTADCEGVAVAGRGMKVAYFVHDMADAAVHRRIRMLRHFAEVTLVGFRRSDAFPRDLDGIPTVGLGRTADAKLAQRALTVATTLARPAWQRHVKGSTIFLARQLEMLVLAAKARRRLGSQAPLVFECLDVHRLMLSTRMAGKMLRGLEGRLLRDCDMLITSSPAFVVNHFARHATAPPTLLLENKVMAVDMPPALLTRIAAARLDGPPPGAPWRIGWFGMIRCERSLKLLARLVSLLPGLVEVVVAGRPRLDVVPEFDALIDRTPGMTFVGEYDRHRNLPELYGKVHFAWTADFFEAGQNSDWLLPNRLYEGALYGAVPLAASWVETGRWLRERQCGVLFDAGSDEQLAQELAAYFRRLDVDTYRLARCKLARVPLSDLLDDTASCGRLRDALEDLRKRHSQ